MIPQQYIEHWRNLSAPWQADSQVEQDLILSRALVDIYSNDVLSTNLAFKGGTALQKLFAIVPSRYSEDIDLVQTEAGPIGEIMGVLRDTLSHWLGKPKYLQNEYGIKFFYRYSAEDGTPMRVKLEVNTREHFSVLGFHKKDFIVDSPWFDGKATIKTFALEELIGTKLKALYQRKKGRDLFDVDYFLKHQKELNLHMVIDCFYAYAKHQGVICSRADIERNLIKKSLDPSFYNDITPLLSTEASKNYDVNHAFNNILEKVCPLFKGDPWNHNFKEDCPLTHFINSLKRQNFFKQASDGTHGVILKDLARKISQPKFSDLSCETVDK